MPDLSSPFDKPITRSGERNFSSLPLPVLSEEPKELAGKDTQDPKMRFDSKSSSKDVSQRVSSNESSATGRRSLDPSLIDILEIGSDAVFKGNDNKFRNDVLNAMEYFERQRAEMTTMNR